MESFKKGRYLINALKKNRFGFLEDELETAGEEPRRLVKRLFAIFWGKCTGDLAKCGRGGEKGPDSCAFEAESGRCRQMGHRTKATDKSSDESGMN